MVLGKFKLFVVSEAGSAYIVRIMKGRGSYSVGPIK